MKEFSKKIFVSQLKGKAIFTNDEDEKVKLHVFPEEDSYSRLTLRPGKDRKIGVLTGNVVVRGEEPLVPGGSSNIGFYLEMEIKTLAGTRSAFLPWMPGEIEEIN